MVAWPLILIIIAMLAGLLVVCTYMLAHYHHPDDANTAWFPKAVVVLGFSAAALSVLLLPLDVANRNSGSTLDMLLFVYIVYPLVAFLALVVIPFAMFYYEAEEAENNSKSKQLYSALCYTFWTVIVFAGIVGILYGLIGKAEIPVQALTARLQPGDAPLNTPCSGCTSTKVDLVIHVSLLVYLVGALSFVGIVLFVCFGGVGMIALPVDLVRDFVDRPRRIPLDVLAHRKVEIGVQASRLLAEGEELARRTREKGGKRNRKDRKAYAKFEKKVYLLEKNFKKNVVAHSRANTRHPWWYVFDLVLGIFCGLASFLWVLHIILYMMVDPPASPFLNDMFIDLDKAFPLFGTSAYALFTLFLLWAVIKGNVKVGLRIAWFTIHPMIPGETLMSSLLFNAALILLSSLAVTQFTAAAFFSYARLTAVSSVFAVQISHLRGIKHVINNTKFFLVIMIGLTFLYYACCGTKRKLKKDDDDDD
ncbi:LIMR family protein [Thecamonas trahens ATCC 50062]|uniref:LIMR family protein n=1 Tax=Thecamonas trahens ATCC 50062 TaxID=461836 RepID=A0A0L0DN76_THETB|nr:LIMR family protein [Thecamonas trahens ATCC 50062]KNC53710.1 LIMR family protein [Thecamonas trahens ATCC 50062]|eukprot:XP_013762024.1 LIMR family protein [Thecamonas trahens ATCC 50062]